jgi:hypothetical protein
MERRDFLKLSSAVMAGLAVAPVDVITGMVAVSTTAYFVFTLEWFKGNVPCGEIMCNATDHSKLVLNRYQIDAFDATEAHARVTALIPEGNGRILNIQKVSDRLSGWTLPA